MAAAGLEAEIEQLDKALQRKESELHALKETLRQREAQLDDVRTELKEIERRRPSASVEGCCSEDMVRTVVARLLRRATHKLTEEAEERFERERATRPPLTLRVVDGRGSVDGVSADEISTIMRLPAHALVRDLLNEAAKMWAIAAGSVLPSLDGALLPETAVLGELVPADQEGMATVRLLATRPMARRPDAELELETVEVMDLRREEAEATLAQIHELEAMPAGKAMHGRTLTEQAEVVRDTCLYVALLLLLLFAYLVPLLQLRIGGPGTVATTQVFTRKVSGALRSISFPEVRSTSDIYEWMDVALREELLGAIPEDSALPTNASVWYIDSGLGEVVGTVRFRQLRVRPNATCEVTEKAQSIFSACVALFSEDTRDVQTFGPNAVQLDPAFQFTTRTELELQVGAAQSGFVRGLLAQYPASGFFRDVGQAFRKSNKLEKLIAAYDKTLDTLRNNEWIDGQTAAVIVQYNAYFPGADMFRASTFLFEQHKAGQFSATSIPFADLAGTVLDPSGGILVAQVLLGAGMACLFVVRLFHFRYLWVDQSKPFAFFADAYAMIDLAMVALYVAVAGLQLKARGDFRELAALAWEKMDIFVSFDDVARTSAGFFATIGFLVAAVFMRCALQLRFLHAGAVVVAAMGRTVWSISLLVVSSLGILAAFVLTFWQLMGGLNEDISTYAETWMGLTADGDVFYALLREDLLRIAHDAPVLGWYTVLVLFCYLYLFRLVLFAVAAVFAIHHFTEVLTSYKDVAKRLASLRRRFSENFGHEKARLELVPSSFELGPLVARVFSLRAALRLDKSRDMSKYEALGQGG